MAEPDDIRRRVDRLEIVTDDQKRVIDEMRSMQATMQGIVRENSMQLARQNEILIELKDELKLRRQDLNEIHEIKLKIATLVQSGQIGGWVGKTIAGAAIVSALAFIFRDRIPL